MNASFYTAAIGAMGQQDRLDVIANNLTNVNTVGYKSKNAVFSDLIYRNLNGNENERTNLQAGSGIRVEKTDTDFQQGGFTDTGDKFDYGINGKGFFALYDPTTQETTYTRDGSFQLSVAGNVSYLASSDGKQVLDKNGQAIIVTDQEAEQNIGIFEFPVENGMESAGYNNFTPLEKNGQPFLSPSSTLRHKSLEDSNVNVGVEYTRMMESQKAYNYALKMLQTSDEVEDIINRLR